MKNFGEPQQGMQGYEGNLKTTYAELGKSSSGIEQWGNVEVDGGWQNVYTSPEFIKQHLTDPIIELVDVLPIDSSGAKLIDVGGGDGYLLNMVANQLERAGIAIASSANFDLDPSGKAFETMQAKINSGQYRDDLRMVKANVLEGMPMRSDSQDIALSRCAIQYVPQTHHIKFIENIIEVVKPGGVLLLQYPSHIDVEPFNTLMQKISEVVSGGSGFQRDFPGVDDFSQSEELQRSSIETKTAGAVCSWPFSAEAWGHRFNLDATKIAQIEELYHEADAKSPGLCADYHGHFCLDTVLAQVVLLKGRE